MPIFRGNSNGNNNGKQVEPSNIFQMRRDASSVMHPSEIAMLRRGVGECDAMIKALEEDRIPDCLRNLVSSRRYLARSVETLPEDHHYRVAVEGVIHLLSEGTRVVTDSGHLQELKLVLDAIRTTMLGDAPLYGQKE